MIFRRLLWALLLAGVCSANVVGSDAAAADPAIPPSIILITLDTTRADRIGFLGSRLGLTPNLDVLASKGAIFSKAYAHVPLTTPSHATILTGTYSQYNHLGTLGTALARTCPISPLCCTLAGTPPRPSWDRKCSIQKVLPLPVSVAALMSMTPASTPAVKGRAAIPAVRLGATGNWAASAVQFEAAVARAPQSDDVRFFLALAYDNLGRTADAEGTYRETLKINPNHFRGNLFLGRLFGMQNNGAAALPFLLKAERLQPQSPDAHAYLSKVYVELGQSENARREQAEAERLGSAAHP